MQECCTYFCERIVLIKPDVSFHTKFAKDDMLSMYNCSLPMYISNNTFQKMGMVQTIKQCNIIVKYCINHI